MGDMADYHLDQMIDAEYLNEGEWDEEEGIPQATRSVACRYCGSTGLKWCRVNGAWRLYRGKELHCCEKYKPAEPEKGGD